MNGRIGSEWHNSHRTGETKVGVQNSSWNMHSVISPGFRMGPQRGKDKLEIEYTLQKTKPVTASPWSWFLYGYLFCLSYGWEIDRLMAMPPVWKMKSGVQDPKDEGPTNVLVFHLIPIKDSTED